MLNSNKFDERFPLGIVYKRLRFALPESKPAQILKLVSTSWYHKLKTKLKIYHSRLFAPSKWSGYLYIPYQGEESV